MAFKTSLLLTFICAALLLIQAAPNKEIADIERRDILFIQNPDESPVVLRPADLPSVAERNNLVCTAAMCRNVCNALGFIFGRCNINNVCVCSNF